MIVREYSRPCRCNAWRGLIPPLAVAGFIVIAATLGYEIGRYHGNPEAFVEAVRQRFVIIEPEWQTAEPNHHGNTSRNR